MKLVGLVIGLNSSLQSVCPPFYVSLAPRHTYFYVVSIDKTVTVLIFAMQLVCIWCARDHMGCLAHFEAAV